MVYVDLSGAVAFVAILGFLLAAAIPAFGGLIGVVGSVLGSFFSFILPGQLLGVDHTLFDADESCAQQVSCGSTTTGTADLMSTGASLSWYQSTSS